MSMEKAMDEAAQGEWRVVAQRRDVWKGRLQGFLAKMDLPWASGRQTMLEL